MSNETPKRSLGEKFSAFVTQRPWVTLFVSIAVMAGVTSGMGRMKANFTHTAFFEKSDPELQAFERFERRFGNDDAVIVVVHSPSGIFDAETATLLRTLTEKMWQVPEVIRVDSLSNFQWVHAEGDEIEIEPLLPREGEFPADVLAERKKVALEHEVLPGYLVSKDGTSALVYARLKPGIDKAPDAEKITSETKKVVESLKSGDHEFHLSGGPIINDAFRESSSHDLSRLIPMLLGMVALLLVATLRSAGGVVMSFVVIFATVITSLAMSGWLGIEMSSVTFSLPQILIAVCVADAVHLLVGFYHARKAGLTRRDAAYHTLSKNFIATLLTSFTTALGFYSFATAHLPPVAGLGILAGTGTMLAWLISYGMVGPLLVLWPGKEPTHGAPTTEDALHHASPRTVAFVGFIERNRIAIMATFAVLAVVAAAISTKNIVNSNPYEYFSKKLPVRIGQEFILEKLSGIASFELVVDAHQEDGIKDPAFMRKVEELEKRALQIPGVTRAVSLVDILRQMNRALSGGDDADYKLPTTKEGIAQELLLYTMGLPQGMDVNDRVTVKYDALRVTLVSTITDSNTSVATANQLEQIGKELGLDVQATGKMWLYQSMNGHVVQSFLQSLGLALVLIGLVMLASFKSLKLGLISVIPNIVPLVFGGAVLYFLSGRLDIGTVMVASVSLGIAVDNTIHILSNFNRHMAEGYSPRESLAMLLAHAGPAMVSTNFILVAGFLTLALGTFIPNVYFGLMTATILTIGLLADFVLLPALLLTLVKEPAKATAVSNAVASADETQAAE